MLSIIIFIIPLLYYMILYPIYIMIIPLVSHDDPMISGYLWTLITSQASLEAVESVHAALPLRRSRAQLEAQLTRLGAAKDETRGG